MKSEFGPDGTQAPPPPRLFPDPLAGLVTADRWIPPQWTAYSSSRVSVPTPPMPTAEMRQAVWSAMEQEQRRPRGRRSQNVQRQQQVHAQYLQVPQMSGGQQQQPAKPANSAASLIGCLVVLGFFVLVIINILGSIFSG